MARDIDVSIVIRAKDEASKIVASVGETIQKHAKAIGIAMTGIGVAGLKLSSDAATLNAQLGVTAISLGIGTDEMRKLALEVSNVTFPIEEVAMTFDLLTRAGIKNKDEMVTVANAFDNLADATGGSASQIATMLLPALKAYGVDLADAGKYIDTFTWLSRNTTIGLEDFSAALTYLAPDMDTLGISIDDTVAILAVLESRGITGAAATRELRKSVTEAVKEEKSLAETLGITQDEIKMYSEQITNATGLTDIYAEAANKQFTLMDQLKHQFKELSLSVGHLLTPLEPLLGVMSAMGPVLIFLSTKTGIATVSFIAHTAATIAHAVAAGASAIATGAMTTATIAFSVALNLVKIALGPIGLAIMALTAIGILLWKNWDTIVNFFKVTVVNAFKKVWEFLKEWGLLILGIIFPPALVIGAVIKFKDEILGALTSAWESIKGFFVKAFDFLSDIASKVFKGVLTFWLAPFKGLLELIKKIAAAAAKVPILGAVAKPILGLVEAGLAKIDELTYFGAGGIATKPTLAVLGERGPEAVVPLRGAATTGGIAGHIEINLHVGYMLGDREDAEKLLDFIQSGLRARQRYSLGEAVY